MNTIKKIAISVLLTAVFSSMGFAGTDKSKEGEPVSGYEAWFIPAVGFNYFQPKSVDSIGTFHGISLDYVFFTWIHQRSSHDGPSHLRVYGKLNVLNSEKQNINSMFMYGFGLTLSLENDP